MKKVFAILLVLAVVAGFVFADPTVGATEKHTVKVSTDVEGVVPVFQLKNSIDTSLTNDGKVAYNNTTDKNYDETADVVDSLKDISKEDIEATFTLYLQNEAKQVRNYNVVFSSTGFNVTRNGEGGYTTVESETVAYDIASTVKGVVSNGDIANNTAKLHFNGTTCGAGNLVTYTVKFKSDPTVDPTNEGATYQATITMTIQGQ